MYQEAVFLQLGSRYTFTNKVNALFVEVLELTWVNHEGYRVTSSSVAYREAN